MKNRVLVGAVCVLLVVFAGAVKAASGRATGAGGIGVRVLYRWQECASAEPGGLKPVTAGVIQLSRPGSAAVKVELEEDGTSPARVTVPGRGPIMASLILQTPKVAVIAGAFPGVPHRIPLGAYTRVPKSGRLTFVVRSEEAGYVNALIELERAARVAYLEAPRPLQQVRARVYGGGSEFIAPDRIEIGTGDDWEPFVLDHEYGHFLLHEVAPSGTTGGEHFSNTSYPDRPILAWDEGFASAFSAIVHPEWHGQIPRGCHTSYDVASEPAAPDLKSDRDRRYAQYNELRGAAVIYQLMGWLAGGDAGLKILLSGLERYHRDNHSVASIRDLRDLAAEQFETGAADHVAVDKIFSGQWISWYRFFTVTISPQALLDAGQQYANDELALHVTGPGGFDCHTTRDLFPSPDTLGKLDDGTPVAGVKEADGGLSFSADDDCYLISGDGQVSADPVQNGPPIFTVTVVMPFPYLSGLRHWDGDFDVKVKFVCTPTQEPPGFPYPGICPASVKADLTALSRNDDPASPRIYHGVVLSRNTDQTVASFSASGKCKVFAPSGDTHCSL